MRIMRTIYGVSFKRKVIVLKDMQNSFPLSNVKYRSLSISPYISLSIKILRSLEGLSSEAEVNDKIEEILPQNSYDTRRKIRYALKMRYIVFNEGLLIRTPLLELVSNSNDMTLLRELLYYHYLQAERIGAEIVRDILYPRLPRASYDETDIKNYLSKKMSGVNEKTRHSIYSHFKSALNQFGLLKKVNGQWSASSYSPKLETFVYALYHEFTVIQTYLNPKMSYLFEKAEFPRLFLMPESSIRDYVQRARLTKLISYETCEGEEQVALIHKSLDRAANEMIRRMEGK